MTLCDLPIKTLLAFQRKQIYSEASLTHFSAINISYNYSLPIIILIVPNTSLHFRKLSDLSRNTIQFGTAIYQAKFFSPIIAIKYILKHLHHTFQLLIYHIHALPIIILIVPNTSLHFRKLSDLSRNTV